MRFMSPAWVLVACFATGCEQSSFSGGGGKKSANVVPKPPQPQELSETFKTDQAVKSPVDIIWVIDNSGSMTDNIAKVRKNFNAFVTSLGTTVDVRIILLSAPSSIGALGLSLPSTAVGGVQISNSVQSNDGAILAAAASCEASLTQSETRVCGETVTSGGMVLMSNTEPTDVAGKFRPSFRAGASRVYVFVTDDESWMKGDAFVRIATAANAGVAPRVFAFRGTSSSSCDISNPGLQYDAMIKATGGEGFDICLSDWSPSFSKLTSSISSMVTTAFTLKSVPNPTTVKVYLNGALLPASAYTLVGAQLSLKQAPDATKVNEIKVIYQVGN